MKTRGFRQLIVPIVGLSILAACAPAAAPSPSPSVAASATATPSPSAAAKYAKVGNIDLPTQTTSFDFAAIDPSSKTLFLADRTNKGVDVISLATEKYVSTIGGFVGLKGPDNSGPNGLAVVSDLNQLWATDGDSTVKVIDLAKGSVIATIASGGKNRGDDVAYDPQDKLVMMANDAETTPFLTFISAADRKILGKLELPGAGGIEGLLWSPSRSVFFVSVPTTKTNPGGEVDLVDPKTMKVTQVYPVKDCYPHGIAFGPRNQMVLACSNDAIQAGAKAQTLIMDATNGSIVATVPEIGGSDIAVFNPTLGHYYLGSSNMTSDGTKSGSPAPALGIIDASTNKFLQGLPTLKSAHTVIADASTGHVYVPIPGMGIAIYALAK